ncbi:MAG TPA: ATP-binding cassette domain-containing protein [Terriglobales bacterium]|nr:ATP-binding cassette domain-containing protein [Terriglobales bacterium]
MPGAAAQTASAPSAPESAPQTIIFQNVSIAFDQNQVLTDISFELTRAETKMLLGVLGSGKSTILKLALGLIKPDRGDIWVLSQHVNQMKEEELFQLRRRIGMVFQESALFDSMTVRENVAYPLTEEHVAPEEIEARVREALRFVELEHTLDLFPAELSGGMRRRVAIARAIITKPEVLLYDSPTAGLDPVTSTTIIELLVKQRDVYHTSALMATHRLADTLTMATHYFDEKANKMLPIPDGSTIEARSTFLVLRDSKIIFDGDIRQLASSTDEYLREYIS